MPFRDNHQSVINWKDAFIKLLRMFDDSSPGLLQRIAAEQSLRGVVALNWPSTVTSQGQEQPEVRTNVPACPSIPKQKQCEDLQ